MAEISSLLTLQGQLALLTLIGFFLARKGIINAQGRKCLTDLLINVILPANIIQSFLVEFSWDVLKSSASRLQILRREYSDVMIQSYLSRQLKRPELMQIM